MVGAKKILLFLVCWGLTGVGTGCRGASHHSFVPETDEDNVAGDTDVLGRPCSNSIECGELMCLGGFCSYPPPCTSDRDCPSNTFCQLPSIDPWVASTEGHCAGQCTGTCPVSNGVFQSCHDGRCYTEISCNPENGGTDCPPSEFCNRATMRCSAMPSSCTTFDQCPAGYECGDQDRCVPETVLPPNGCRVRADCEDVAGCQNGACDCSAENLCVPIPCPDDGGCPLGYLCDPDVCRPAKACIDQAYCRQFDLVCTNNYCTHPQPCVGTTCPPGQTCDDSLVPPLCFPDLPDPCVTNESCPAGTFCELFTNTCQPGCRDNTECVGECNGLEPCTCNSAHVCVNREPASCYSATLDDVVANADCVQVGYPSCGAADCGWYACDDGNWICTTEDSCAGITFPNADCDVGPVGSPCSSTELGHDVTDGACVQSTVAVCGEDTCAWQICNDGAWACTPLADCTDTTYPAVACQPTSFDPCYSQTLGRDVTHGTCVQVSYSGCGAESCAWYECDNGTWLCTPPEFCAGDTHPHESCAQTGDCGSLDYLGSCEGLTLRWCENDTVHTLDCGADGRICSWVNETVGYNCLEGTGCGDITYLGTCNDQTLAWCEGGVIQTSDCASLGKVCGWQNDTVGFNCLTTSDTCYSVELERDVSAGTCVEVDDDACGLGSCSWYRCDGGGWACVDLGSCSGDTYPNDGCLASACGDLDYLGECQGSVLRWCEGNEIHSLDCSLTSQICAWQDDGVGYNCLVDDRPMLACHSAIQGLDVPHGACEQRVPATCADQNCCPWYQCNDGTWEETMIGSCTDTTYPNSYCDQGTGCGNLDYNGECVETILRWCAGSYVKAVDCALKNPPEVCGWTDQNGYDCVAEVDPPSPCASTLQGGDVPHGSCEQRQDTGCATGDCSWYQCQDGAWACIESDSCTGETYPNTACDPCAGVDFLGECVDDLLRWCQDDTLHTVDCTLTNKVCGWQDAGVGYNCLEDTGPRDPCYSDGVGQELVDGACVEVSPFQVSPTEVCGASTCGWIRCDDGNWVCSTVADCVVENHVNISCSSCGTSTLPSEFVWPVPTNLTVYQKFGNPISYQSCGFHTGIDVMGAEGDDLLAIADGLVVYVGPLWLDCDPSVPPEDCGVGRGPYAIVVQHAPNFYSTYGHNRAALVSTGECVSAGQTIAEMGNCGYSGAPHLHFEIINGTPFTGNWRTPFENACTYYEDPQLYVRAGCNSSTLGRQVVDSTCLQMNYAACNLGSCGWMECNNGVWDCVDPAVCTGDVFPHDDC